MAQRPGQNGFVDEEDIGGENGGSVPGTEAPFRGRPRRPEGRSEGREGRSEGRFESRGEGRFEGQQGPGGPRRGRFQPRRKICIFCADKDKVIDWKKFDQLRRFIGDSGEIYPRRKSGLCARHQRGVAVAIKRARQIALLPYTGEHMRVMGRGGNY